MGKLSMEADAERLQLYRQGLCDREIGERVDRARKTIVYWRLSRGLEGYQKPRRQYLSSNAAELIAKSYGTLRMRLYLNGASDKELARRTERTASSIRAWRRLRGLPPNRAEAGGMLSPDEEAMRRKLLEAGGWDSVIGRIMGRTPETISEWRLRRKLSARRRPPMVRRVYDALSLDAPLSSGALTLLDLIADPSQSEWLEENGSTAW